MSFDDKLAAYVLRLERCLASTHRAEDRAVYQSYLADAAGILAASVLREPSAQIKSRIEAHERLWGHTWLQDPVYQEAANAWNAIKNETNHIAS